MLLRMERRIYPAGRGVLPDKSGVPVVLLRSAPLILISSGSSPDQPSR